MKPLQRIFISASVKVLLDKLTICGAELVTIKRKRLAHVRAHGFPIAIPGAANRTWNK